MKRQAWNERGFTLIEMLIVVALIGILATIAVGQYQRSIVKAKEAALLENLFVMRSQINNYFADKGEYPYDLQTLVDEHYLKRIPNDPITRSRDTWVVTYSDLGNEEDISTEQGIEDVRSGADRLAIDGTPYADW
ncbi:MAG: type II secretion system protein [Acidobacteria bacterium]|nr:MAG: type II secretion system protein [Acidobacteriota bacterium]